MRSSILGRTTISAACVSLAVLSTLLFTVSLANAQAPDFSIDANPISLCVNPGINAQSVITVSSVGGFAGTVYLGDSISPSTSNGPTLSSIPASETLSSGQSVSFDLTMFTTTSTTPFVYTITVSGLSGSLHSATIELAVSADCSVGGVIVPTTLGSIASDLVLGIAMAGVAGAAIAALVIYVSRSKFRVNP